MTVSNAMERANQSTGIDVFRGTEREERAFAVFMQGSLEAPRTSVPPMDWARVMGAIKALYALQERSAAR